MDLSTRTIKTYGNEDQRWIAPGGQRALRDCDTITLDRSAFDLVTLFPNGFIPSGVVLGRITATGLYAPYSGTTDEVQTITEGGSGLTSFTLTYSGQTTGSIAAAATAATVQTALEALSNIAPGDVVVTGGAGGPYTVTFAGTLADTNVAQMTATPTGGTGTVTVATFLGGGTDAASDGTEVAVGFLAVSVPYDRNSASTADLVAALLWHGEIVESMLPLHHGLDANAKTDLAAKFRFV